MRFAIACCVLALTTTGVFAQSAGGGTPTTQTNTTVSNAPTSASGTLTPFTATTTSAQLVAANSSRKYLFVSNEATSSGGTIAVCPTSVASPGINVAGCKTLYPGQFFAPCSTAFCPADAFNVIGSVSTPGLYGQN